jgi:hypothetical protein
VSHLGRIVKIVRGEGSGDVKRACCHVRLEASGAYQYVTGPRPFGTLPASMQTWTRRALNTTPRQHQTLPTCEACDLAAMHGKPSSDRESSHPRNGGPDAA